MVWHYGDLMKIKQSTIKFRFLVFKKNTVAYGSLGHKSLITSVRAHAHEKPVVGIVSLKFINFIMSITRRYLIDMLKSYR